MIQSLSRRLLPVALLLLPVVPVQAACLTPAEAMSCQVSKSRELEVCAGSEMFTYSFGAGDRRDLEISVPFADAEVTPWPGIGSAIWSSILFRSGEHSYEVFVSAEREAGAELTGGVIVSRNDTQIARLECLPGTVEASPEVFPEVMEARGFCWNGNAGLWQMAGSC